MVLSHYLNQCWLIIIGFCHLHQANLQEMLKTSVGMISLKKYTCKITPTSFKDQWVNTRSPSGQISISSMGLLPDTQNCGLRMRRECRERFPRHRLQRKPPVGDPDMHYGTCVTHVPWCMSVSLTRGDGENVPGIPGACAIRNIKYLVRGPWPLLSHGYCLGDICYIGGIDWLYNRVQSCVLIAVFRDYWWAQDHYSDIWTLMHWKSLATGLFV